MVQTFTSFQDFKRRYPIRPNDKGALLGSGSYGRVIKVEDQLETEWVAIKVSEFKGNDTKSLKAEVELAQRVPRQANIARYDACHRLETDTSISDFAIMKYYPDGNLADLLRNVTLTSTQIYDITQGILLGLQHLHKHRIVHRDFKPANILISRDNAGRFIPKIADFGLSKLVSEDELDSSDFDLSDGRGTPSYKAPEQIEGSRVSFNLDLWAFGVILYEIMTGEKPFKADSKNSSEQSVRREIEKKIITVELPARLSQISQPYRSIIQRCLVRDIHERVRKEDELLDLLDGIPQLIIEAKAFFDSQQYKEALGLFEQVLIKRERHIEAQKGVTQCKTALEEQHINSLLNDANGLLAQQQFEKAKSRYEQVLRLKPTNANATRGLALCVDRLRPKPSFIESELTDVYQEESTDVYVAPLVPVAIEQTPKVATVKSNVSETVISSQLPTNKPLSQPTVLPAVTRPVEKLFLWRAVAPVAVGLAGVALYFALTSTPKTVVTAAVQQTESAIAGPVLPPGGKYISPEPGIVPKPGESKAVLNKQIDGVLGKAKQAFQRKAYEQVIMMTGSALRLDPTREDVASLRTAAGKEIEKKKQDDKLTTSVTPTLELPKVTVPMPETDKPKPEEPTAKENPVNVKQQAQENYDQLIEEGMKAITNGNNKAKAIATFNKAQALAKENELNTDKADEAYTYNINKANKLFDRDEFDGAKDWYEVARSVKDSPEVRRKIKLCTNQ